MSDRNIFLFAIVLATCFISCDYYIINPHKEDIGYVSKEDALDTDFEFCYKEKIFPYYYGRNPARYRFGKDSLKQYFKLHYANFGDTSSSGFITFRFGINCKGEAGRYVVEQVGTDFKPKQFNPKIVENLYTHLKALQEWEPIAFYDDRYDSFIHITFKLENGSLLEILP
jgi:hypothetical protein